MASLARIREEAAAEMERMIMMPRMTDTRMETIMAPMTSDKVVW